MHITHVTSWHSAGVEVGEGVGMVSDSVDVCDSGGKSPRRLSMCGSATAGLRRQHGSARALSSCRMLRTSVIQRVMRLNLLLN